MEGIISCGLQVCKENGWQGLLYGCLPPDMRTQLIAECSVKSNYRLKLWRKLSPQLFSCDPGRPFICFKSALLSWDRSNRAARADLMFRLRRSSKAKQSPAIAVQQHLGSWKCWHCRTVVQTLAQGEEPKVFFTGKQEKRKKGKGTYPAGEFGDTFVKNKSGAVAECMAQKGGGSGFWCSQISPPAEVPGEIRWMRARAWNESSQQTEDGENVRRRERHPVGWQKSSYERNALFKKRIRSD